MWVKSHLKRKMWMEFYKEMECGSDADSFDFLIR